MEAGMNAASAVGANTHPRILSSSRSPVVVIVALEVALVGALVVTVAVAAVEQGGA